MFSRITALAPSISETICFLGEQKRLIAVTDFCNYPNYCNSLPKIGGFANPKVDEILKLKPDLILATTLHNTEKLQVFTNASIEVIQIEAQQLFDAPNTIKQVGKALSIEKKALQLADQLSAEMSKIIQKGEKLKGSKKVCYLCTSSKFCNHKSKCQTNTLVEQLGGELCMYQKESIVQDIVNSNPDVIIIPYLESSKDWKIQNDFIQANQELKQTKAFKNNKIRIINGELLSRPGPRAAEGLNKLFQLIHN